MTTTCSSRIVERCAGAGHVVTILVILLLVVISSPHAKTLYSERSESVRQDRPLALRHQQQQDMEQHMERSMRVGNHRYSPTNSPIAPPQSTCPQSPTIPLQTHVEGNSRLYFELWLDFSHPACQGDSSQIPYQQQQQQHAKETQHFLLTDETVCHVALYHTNILSYTKKKRKRNSQSNNKNHISELQQQREQQRQQLLSLHQFVKVDQIQVLHLNDSNVVVTQQVFSKGPFLDGERICFGIEQDLRWQLESQGQSFQQSTPELLGTNDRPHSTNIVSFGLQLIFKGRNYQGDLLLHTLGLRYVRVDTELDDRHSDRPYYSYSHSHSVP